MKHDKRELDSWCEAYVAVRSMPYDDLSADEVQREGALTRDLKAYSDDLLMYAFEKARARARSAGCDSCG